MCLTRIKHFIHEKYFKLKSSGTGIKIFSIAKDFFTDSADELFQIFYSLDGLRSRTDDPVPTGQWLKARPGLITCGASWPFEQYEAGFHILLDKTDAECWKADYADRVAVKVRYRGARILGEQDFDGRLTQVIVADEMYVPRRWKCILTGREGGSR